MSSTLHVECEANVSVQQLTKHVRDALGMLLGRAGPSIVVSLEPGFEDAPPNRAPPDTCLAPAGVSLFVRSIQPNGVVILFASPAAHPDVPYVTVSTWDHQPGSLILAASAAIGIASATAARISDGGIWAQTAGTYTPGEFAAAFSGNPRHAALWQLG